MRTQLDEILVFMAVVDAGSFAGGATATGLTRSAAGKAVGRLEDRLGARLLTRTTRRISVTDAGRSFYEHGTKIAAAVEEAEASVAGGAGLPRGTLRLTVPDAFGRLVVLPILAKFLDAWPSLQVEVSFTDRQLDLVEEGFDLAIRIGSRGSGAHLVSRVVAHYDAMLVASPKYLRRRGEPASVDDLARHDCLLFSSHSRRQSWQFRTAGGAWCKAPVRSRIRMDSGDALRNAAVAGLGIAYLPNFIVAADLSARRLRRVLPDVNFGKVEITAIYPDRRLLEPRVRRFIDFLVESLAP